MSEFESLNPVPTPVTPQAAPPQQQSSQKKESLLTRPLFLGQSLPWLLGGSLVIAAAAWYLFWPSSPSTEPAQLAFGQSSGLTVVQPAPVSSPAPLQMEGLSAVDAVSTVPEDVVKLIREGREFETANREAITRLSDTVRAQSAALAALQSRADALASENSRLSNRVTVMEAHQTAPSSGRSTGGKSARRPALSGMKLEGIQNGMAWINWQNRTWAVQAGEQLGSVSILDVNAEERSVATSAGILH